MCKREGRNKTVKKNGREFSCQHNYSTDGPKSQLEKYLDVLQDQCKQYICICVVRGKIFNHLPKSSYCIEKAWEIKGQ